MLKQSFVFLLVLCFIGAVYSAACRTHDNNCLACTQETEFACGFCGETGECLRGTASGPSFPLTESSRGGCPSLWQVDFASHVIKTGRGYPVNPITADIFLVSNQPVSLLVQITRPFSDDVPIDLVVVQDASGSMTPYMTLFGNVVPRIMAGLYANYKSSYFAHNSYIDKPVYNFAWYQRPDYVLQFNTPGLESNPSTMQLAAKKSIESIGSGWDWPEDPHDALAMVLDCRSIQKWRTNARKFTFLATDASFHKPGDHANRPSPEYYCREMCRAQFNTGQYSLCRKNPRNPSGCGSAPNPGPSVTSSQIDNYCYEPTPWPGSSLWTGYNYGSTRYDNCPYIPRTYDLTCPPDPSNTMTLTLAQCPFRDQTWAMGVEFISTDALRTKYLNSNVIPILGSTRTSGTTDYPPVFTAWGFGAVTNLGDTPDSVVNAILAEIDAVASRIQLRTTDTQNYVNSISPSAGYTNVALLQTVDFTVVFRKTNPANNYKVTLVALGFPEVIVTIWTTVQCFGCDGVAFSGTYVDLCGICEPPIPNACLGCDGVPYSGAVPDNCGVCAGNNSACAGCDGIPNSGTAFDVCNVCGGDGTTCLDCENVPFGGKRVDSCGVCGGTDSCYGCDGVAFSNKTVDQCGLCGGNDACLGCDGVPGNKVVDLCGVCGGDNACVGCDGIVNSSLVLDDCGVCGGDNSTCPFGCDGIRSPTPKVEDRCGVCGGNDSCLGCDYQPFSNTTFDECGICGGDNYCVGCDGIARPDDSQPPAFDQCGVCGGNNTCVGCDFVANSGLKVDLCGVCGGNNECLGCDQVPNSGLLIDDCGVCNGTNDCFDCDGIPYGNRQLDVCGECGGSNSSCAGCDGVPYSNATFDSCGVCQGNNTCLYVNIDPNPGEVPIEPWIPATLITIGVVALIAGILAAVALLSVGAAVGGPLWALPAGLLSQLNSANISEIHKPRDAKVNPLAA